MRRVGCKGSALTQPKPHWYPKEQLSPTQLSMYAQCRRKWTLAYLFGIKEGKRGKSKLLGSVIHACLEAYARGGNVYDPDLRDLERELAHLTEAERADLLAEAPKRAIVAVPYIPLPHEAERYPETKFEGVCAVSALHPSGDPEDETRFDPLRFVLKLDLLARYHGAPWYLYDYKSTKGKRVTGKGFDPWFYVPSVEALQRDVQSVFYALEVMLQLDLDELWCRWVYTCTERKELPVSKCVDFLMTREHCERQIEGWLELAYEMRQHVRDAIDRNGPPELADVPPPSALPPHPDTPCEAFGGCPYRAKALGPCDPGHGSIGLAVLHAKQPKPKEEPAVMSLEERVQAAANGVGDLPHNAPEGYAAAKGYSDPNGPFPIYAGDPSTDEPTGEPWLDEHGQSYINPKGQRLDTGGHPMPAPTPVAPPAVKPPAARPPAPPAGVAPPRAAVGNTMVLMGVARVQGPPPPPAPAAPKATVLRRPRQKNGESAEAYAVRVAEYEAAKRGDGPKGSDEPPKVLTPKQHAHIGAGGGDEDGLTGEDPPDAYDVLPASDGGDFPVAEDCAVDHDQPVAVTYGELTRIRDYLERLDSRLDTVESRLERMRDAL